MKKLVECTSCGEELLATIAAKSQGLCLECYREKVLGEIPKVTSSGRGGGGGRKDKDVEDTDGGAAPEDFEGISDEAEPGDDPKAS